VGNKLQAVRLHVHSALFVVDLVFHHCFKFS